LTPVEVPEGDLSYGDFLSEKGKQLGLGAVLGGGAGKLTQMMLAPQVSAQTQRLKDLGVTSMTPGQLMSDIPAIGKALQRTESQLTSLPVSGSLIQGAMDRTAFQFNRGIGNKILEPIGQTLPKDIRPGNQMIAYLDDKLDDVYRGLENKINFSNVTNPQTNQSTMDFFIKKYTDVAQDKVIEHQAKIFDEFKQTVLDPLQRKGTLSGAEFRQAEKALGAKARTYIANPATQDIGFALRDLQSALRNELSIQNPAVGAELRASHEMFKRYLRAERAASYRGAQEGVFSPEQFRSAVEFLAGRKGTATGRGIFMPEAQAGSSVLGRGAPDSGTAGRLTATGLVDAAANIGTLGAPLLGTAAIYNPLSMYLMTKAATSRPQAFRDVNRLIQQPQARTIGALSAMNQQQPPEPQISDVIAP
jgi:hypothetical protein